MLIGCVLCAPQLGRYSDLIAVEEGAFIVGGVLERECSLFLCATTYCFVAVRLYIVQTSSSTALQ